MQVRIERDQSRNPSAKDNITSGNFTASIHHIPRKAQLLCFQALPCFVACFFVSITSNVHRKEQPAVTQSAFMTGPVVQHGNLEADPAEVFG